MGRKRKARFEWVADDAEGEAVEKVERPNRSAEKRRRKRLEALAKEMAELSEGQRALLAVDDEVRETLAEYNATGTTPNRRRVLLRLENLLVDEEPEDLEQAIADARSGRTS